MNASTVNLVATLFIATFTITAILWLALYVSGQADMNVTVADDTDEGDEAGNDGFTWS